MARVCFFDCPKIADALQTFFEFHLPLQKFQISTIFATGLGTAHNPIKAATARTVKTTSLRVDQLMQTVYAWFVRMSFGGWGTDPAFFGIKYTSRCPTLRDFRLACPERSGRGGRWRWHGIMSKYISVHTNRKFPLVKSTLVDVFRPKMTIVFHSLSR
jgi:hypothetical protein